MYDDSIDDIWENGHFRNDDGTEFDPKLVPIPELCYKCKKYGRRGEDYVLCTLNRADQQDEEDFQCGDYKFIGDKRLINNKALS